MLAGNIVGWEHLPVSVRCGINKSPVRASPAHTEASVISPRLPHPFRFASRVIVRRGPLIAPVRRVCPTGWVTITLIDISLTSREPDYNIHSPHKYYNFGELSAECSTPIITIPLQRPSNSARSVPLMAGAAVCVRAALDSRAANPNFSTPLGGTHVEVWPQYVNPRRPTYMPRAPVCFPGCSHSRVFA